ncbi:SEC-C metal-binding domain-containing protein [Blastopirellula retiformator]|uniref:SEC-C metal-binding domain-containing protein n=1 Tax=Blastopirellula retiformator TaxID=2527970 RepID=UPI001FEB3616|nr:SEC-C metal-binding domain-containing protein [Blastopirellula retiformator]
MLRRGGAPSRIGENPARTVYRKATPGNRKNRLDRCRATGQGDVEKRRWFLPRPANVLANLLLQELSKRKNFHQEEVRHATRLRSTTRRTAIFFENMSKRRHGFPSETQVKRGVRIVHGDKLLEEKLGRNDLCPCGSGLRFKRCCLAKGCF